MKRTLIVLCAAFTFSFVGYVGAQSDQYGGSQNAPSKARQHSKTSREVTLTGCLEQGSSANLYVLRNASEGNEVSGATGTSGSSEQNERQMQQGQQSPMDFQLVGKNLKKYVGQRVEIRGVVEPMKENRSDKSDMSSQSGSMSGGSMSGTETGTQGTSGQSGSMSGGSMSGQQSTAGPITHRVKVRSVKELSSSCQ